MSRYKITYGQRFRNLFTALIVPVLILIQAGCGSDHQDSSLSASFQTASADLKIYWHNAPERKSASLSSLAATLNCQEDEVEYVHCVVYDASHKQLTRGDSWRCSDGRGRIDGIPVGEDRIFVVLAEDADGNARYQGTTTGVTIKGGVDATPAVVIVDAKPFIPTLSAPAHGAQVDPNGFALEWRPLENANAYLVLISEDSVFESLVIEETTSQTAYTPSTLLPSTQYFWKVAAIDHFDNIGAECQFRSFTTSDCTYAISISDSFYDSEAATGSFDLTTSFNDCMWGVAAGADWITILSAADGAGNALVRYSIAANNAASQRTGTISAGGQYHTITQSGIACIYQISPTSRSVASEGESYEVTIDPNSEDCVWSTTEQIPWITLSPEGGTGTDSVLVTVAANSGPERSADITIAGITHTVTQEETCVYEVMIGDNDGYGYGIDDNADLPESNNPDYNWIFDNRQGPERETDNPARHTDYEPYSDRRFNFTIRFCEVPPNEFNYGYFTFDVSGIQQGRFGPSTLRLDNIDYSDYLPSDQGDFGSNVITITIFDSSLFTDGELTVEFEGAPFPNPDAIAFDFFHLEIDRYDYE